MKPLFAFLLLLSSSATLFCQSDSWFSRIEHAPAEWVEQQQTYLAERQAREDGRNPDRKTTDSLSDCCEIVPLDYARYRRLPSSHSADTAFDILLNTEFFATYSGGFSGTQALAFNIILNHPDARAAFEDLYNRAYTAGKLYALCGLRLLDSIEFEEKVHALPASFHSDSVWTRDGDFIERLSVGPIIAHPEGLRFDMKIDMTARDSVDFVEGLFPTPTAGSTFDIRGGSRPLELLLAGYKLKRQ